MPRKPMIAGNWKMNANRDQAISLARDIRASSDGETAIDKVVCPPYLYLFDVRGARRVHRQPVRGAQLAVAGLGVDADDLVVLHQQAPDRHGHPAALARVVVDARELPALPANRHQLVERRAVDQVPRVVRLLIKKIRRERRGIDGVRAQVFLDALGRELGLTDRVEAVDEFVDRPHAAAQRSIVVSP